jgi:hypothetical protein
VRHFDQSMQAVSTLPGTLTDKLDVMTDMVAYVNELVATGDYPQIAEEMKDVGIDALWEQIQAHARDESRFDRNLARLLDGLQRDFTQE